MHNDRYSAPFDDPDAAIRKVMVFARWSGQDSEVLVQLGGKGNAFCTEWISGREGLRP